MLESLLDWLGTLPPGALYAIVGLTGSVENVFPPFPSDVVIAFGSFVIAQTHNGTMLGVFLSVWSGNVASAMLVYGLGRRYGAERMERRLGGKHAASRDARFRKLLDRYGLPAIFVSRFVPGVRALVPAIAGALKLSAAWVMLMMGTASAIWYGAITVISFRVGSDWERMRDTVARYGTTAAIIATVILAAGIGAWLIAHRQREAR